MIIEHLLRDSLGRWSDLKTWVVVNFGNKGEVGL